MRLLQWFSIVGDTAGMSHDARWWWGTVTLSVLLAMGYGIIAFNWYFQAKLARQREALDIVVKSCAAFVSGVPCAECFFPRRIRLGLSGDYMTLFCLRWFVRRGGLSCGCAGLAWSMSGWRKWKGWRIRRRDTEKSPSCFRTWFGPRQRTGRSIFRIKAGGSISVTGARGLKRFIRTIRSG